MSTVRFSSGLVALIVCLLASHAAAASPEAEAAAEALFLEGRRLFEAGNYEGACRKLTESQRLDPALGTELNLAECYLRLGKTASAWAQFRALRAAARKAGDVEREQLATSRIAEIEPKLSYLIVEVAPGAKVEGLKVEGDEFVITPTMFGTPLPVDPGVHVVKASAPGKRSFSQNVSVAEAADRVTVRVPVLESPTPEPSPQMGSSVVPAAAPAQAVTEPRSATGAGPTDNRASDPGSTQRLFALGTGAVGVLAVGAGIYFGLSAKKKESDSEAYCRPDDKSLCSPTGVELLNDAGDFALLANVGFAVGGAALAAAVVLYVTAPTKPTRAKIELLPRVALDQRGLDLRVTY